jgi:hypothetical protein
MKPPAKQALACALAAVALLGSAWGQSTISFTNSATALGNGTYVSVNLNGFNSDLGTLTGVVVRVNFVTVGGSFSVTATTADDVDVEGAQTGIIVRQAATNTLGFTQLGNLAISPTVTPGLPFTVNGNSQQIFDVSTTNVFTNQTQNIASNFWAAYQSSGGSGNVVFQVRNNANIPNSGGAILLDRNPFTATANMSVTYTYTGAEPIPEPSTVAAGAFLTLLAAASYWRRRRKASAVES